MLSPTPHYIARDAAGFLLHSDAWTAAIAHELAAAAALELHAEHWLVLHYLREFYLNFPDIKIPPQRAVNTLLRTEVAAARASANYLLHLFPEGLLQAYKIAGLPKLSRCKTNNF